MGWDAVAIIGLVLDLGGIAVALVGLDGLSRDLFPNRPMPHRAGWRWFKRSVLRRRPPTQIIGMAAIGSSATMGSARAQVTKGRPDPDAPHGAWIAYWDSRLANLSERIDWTNEDMKAADAKLHERLDSDVAELRAGIDALGQRLLVVVGGEGGRGIVLTWWGLAMTAVGTLMQGVAGIAG